MWIEYVSNVPLTLALKHCPGLLVSYNTPPRAYSNEIPDRLDCGTYALNEKLSARLTMEVGAAQILTIKSAKIPFLPMSCLGTRVSSL